MEREAGEGRCDRAAGRRRRAVEEGERARRRRERRAREREVEEGAAAVEGEEEVSRGGEALVGASTGSGWGAGAERRSQENMCAAWRVVEPRRATRR